MPSPDQITRAYQGAVERLRRDTVSAVESLWYNLPNYRDADIARFKSVAVPLVQGAQSEIAALTAAYQSQFLLAAEVSAPMVMLPREKIAAPRGVDPETVYQRPATTLYTALSRGATMTQAVVAGYNRLRTIVQTDIQLVTVGQSDLSLQRAGVVRYKRRLTGLENCELCLTASTNTYSVGNLMPIHGNCDCTVEAIFPGYQAPESVEIDGERVSAEDARERVEVSRHGELGPTLHLKKDKFTGPSPALTTPRTIEQSLGSANPNFTADAAYKFNCGNSVTAFELQMRGQNVSALGVSQAAVAQRGIRVTDFLEQWRTPSGVVPELSRVGSRTAVERAIREAGAGSRGFVLVNWKRDYGGGGHVFSVVNDGGRVRFLDPQSGIEYAADQFSNVKPQNVWFVRSDNLSVLEETLSGVVQ